MNVLYRGLLVFGFGLVLAGLNGCTEAESGKVPQATVSPDAPKSSEEANKLMEKNRLPPASKALPKSP